MPNVPVGCIIYVNNNISSKTVSEINGRNWSDANRVSVNSQFDRKSLLVASRWFECTFNQAI